MSARGSLQRGSSGGREFIDDLFINEQSFDRVVNLREVDSNIPKLELRCPGISKRVSPSETMFSDKGRFYNIRETLNENGRTNFMDDQALPRDVKIINYNTPLHFYANELEDDGSVAKMADDGLTAEGQNADDDISVASDEPQYEKELELDGDDELPIRVLDVEWNVERNVAEHNTDKYEFTMPRKLTRHRPLLVLRRGQPFLITLFFNRIFSKATDNITLIFETGVQPMVSTGTRIQINPRLGLKKRTWGARSHVLEENKMDVEIMIPCDCIVGKYFLTIETKLASFSKNRNGDDEEEEVNNHERLVLRVKRWQPIFVLFNPWCQMDEVYMEDETLREQYVTSDTGIIHLGNQRQTVSRPWNFSQYSRSVLETCIYLFDSALISTSVRCSPVDVIRAIAFLVNSTDDHGLMKGSWTGTYSDGTAPTQWLSTQAITDEFWETKKAVKYGQCFVFAACATSLCRALGIPARCVTNFSSAHDCDGGNTINTHWNLDGRPNFELNHDYVWSFHVWTEAFMVRRDLPGDYDGWQAIDPTPQLTSVGLRCAGPCSVKAIKNGDTSQRYDGMMFYSELYAHRFHWVMQDDGTYRNIVQPIITGKALRTFNPEKVESVVENDLADALDLSEKYKYNPGTEEERATMQRANTWATHPGVYDCGEGDVRFVVEQKLNIVAGSIFDVSLKLMNSSPNERNVKVVIAVVSSQYTGALKRVIRSQRFDVSLCSLQDKHAVMRVMGEDYSLVMGDHASFVIYTFAHVAQTDQLYVNCEDFLLRLPQLEIEVPSYVRKKKTFDCRVRLTSTMPVALVNCIFMIEAHGILKATKIEHPDIEPFDRVDIVVPMTAKVSGNAKIMVSFHSRELTGVIGSCILNVY